MVRLSVEERFWAKVDKNGPVPEAAPHLGPCWLWTGHLNEDGYGRFRAQDRIVKAHRVAYGLLIEPIPVGLTLDHLCRVRHCVRPDHLEPVTQKENVLRSTTTWAARNAAKVHCPQGHPYDAANTYMAGKRRYCRECRRRRAGWSFS